MIFVWIFYNWSLWRCYGVTLCLPEVMCLYCRGPWRRLLGRCSSQMLPLERKLELELEGGARVIACRFPFPHWTPDHTAGEGVDTVWAYDVDSLRGREKRSWTWAPWGHPVHLLGAHSRPSLARDEKSCCCPYLERMNRSSEELLGVKTISCSLGWPWIFCVA